MRATIFAVSLFQILVATTGQDLNNGKPPFPEVNTPAGNVRGSILKSRLGKDIFSFRGIRYGKAPIGERRFQDPIAEDDWRDTYDATQEGPACPQVNDGLKISEDCLHLNVYTTKLPIESTVRRPVIVFFHPGGFYSFSGQSNVFGPAYFLDKEIILVTVNYRLSTLGFLSTGDELAPGNLGLKDQVVALNWIQRNIASFGGNPRSVTIMGDSAGAWSVILHMLSPMSEDLFHRGIAMSGAPTIHASLPAHQKHLAVKQAELLNCPTTDTRTMIDCLKTKPVEDFVKSYPKFAEWHGDPILVWSPVVEPAIPNRQRFVIGQPVDLIRQRRINDVPLITGVTKDEFGGVTTIFVDEVRGGNDTLVHELNNDWETIAPISFIYERDTTRSKHISKELRKFYFKDQPIGLNNVQGLANLYADAHITYSTHRLAKLMAEYSRRSVWFYKFSYQGRYSFAKYKNGTLYGVVHHDDLQYLFNLGWFPFFDRDSPEINMVETLTGLWSTFATHGRPTRGNEPVDWRNYSPRRDNYLDIDTKLEMKTGLFPERMEFWDRLFPLPPAPPRRD